jgi:hypothetical protein
VEWEIGENTDLTRDCLRPVGGIQLAIDAGRVGLDGARRHDQLLRDLLIGFAQGQEREDF